MRLKAQDCGPSYGIPRTTQEATVCHCRLDPCSEISEQCRLTQVIPGIYNSDRFAGLEPKVTADIRSVDIRH